jgi:hypothetical protein
VLEAAIPSSIAGMKAWGTNESSAQNPSRMLL